MYAGQAVLRFRVSEKNNLPQISTYFLGHPARNVDETISTLVKITSACRSQAHARQLPDPGLEVAVTFPARMPEGVRLTRFSKSRIIALTPVQARIRLYDESRPPARSHESPRAADGKRVWTIDSTTVLNFIDDAQ